MGDRDELHNSHHVDRDAVTGLGGELASLLVGDGTDLLVHGTAGSGRHWRWLDPGIITRCSAGHGIRSACAESGCDSLYYYHFLSTYPGFSIGTTGFHCMYVFAGFSILQYVGTRHHGYSLTALVDMVTCRDQYASLAMVVHRIARYQAQVSRILNFGIVLRQACLDRFNITVVFRNKAPTFDTSVAKDYGHSLRDVACHEH